MRVLGAVRERTKPRLANRHVLATHAPRGSTFRAARALNNSASIASQASLPKKKAQMRAMLACSGSIKHWPIVPSVMPARALLASTYVVRPTKHRNVRCANRGNTMARPEAVFVRVRSARTGPPEYSAQKRPRRLHALAAHPVTLVIQKVKLFRAHYAASVIFHLPARIAFRAPKTSTTTFRDLPSVWIVRQDL